MRICQITVNRYEPAKTKKGGKVRKIATALVVVIVLSMIVSTYERKEARRQELETYHAEQFEKMKNFELEESYIPNIEGTSPKIQETRVDIDAIPQPSIALSQSPELEAIDNEEEVIPEETKTIVVNAEYKPTMLSGYKISAEGPYEDYVYILSEEDMWYIAKLVWAEARGECYEGKVAVAATVLNRYFSEHPDFNRNSILHIITQPSHFANIWNVTEWDMRNDTECMEAVKDACKGWDPTRETFEEGAMYFFNPDGVFGYQAEIRQNIRVMVIGAHAFHYDFEKIKG